MSFLCYFPLFVRLSSFRASYFSLSHSPSSVQPSPSITAGFTMTRVFHSADYPILLLFIFSFVIAHLRSQFSQPLAERQLELYGFGRLISSASTCTARPVLGPIKPLQSIPLPFTHILPFNIRSPNGFSHSILNAWKALLCHSDRTGDGRTVYTEVPLKATRYLQ